MLKAISRARAAGVAAVLAALAPGGAAAAEPLDEGILNNICGDPSTGPDLQAQCAVFDIDAPTRNAAIGGNNLGVAGATGRGKSDVRDRLEALREGTDEDEDTGPSGQSADWTVGRLGLFASGDGSLLDRDSTANEVGHDTVTWGFTAGADWRFSDALVAGAAFSYSNGDTEFNSGAGNLDTRSYGGLIFASFAPTDLIYLDAYAGYGMQTYDGRRNIAFTAGGVPVAATAASDTDGEEWSAGLSAAADFALGAIVIGPHAGLDYLRTEVDGYAESGGGGFAIAFSDQTIESLQSVLGLHASYAHSTEWGVLSPYARLDWVHEFEGDARTIAASFVQSPGTPFTVATDRRSRDFGRAAIGVSALWPGGWVAFADYQNQFGRADEMEHRITVGLRKEF